MNDELGRRRSGTILCTIPKYAYRDRGKSVRRENIRADNGIWGPLNTKMECQPFNHDIRYVHTYTHTHTHTHTHAYVHEHARMRTHIQ